jgi:hypothetical protein
MSTSAYAQQARLRFAARLLASTPMPSAGSILTA